MEYDNYSVGFANGVGILGGHWYSDPYQLFSSWKIDRYYESSLVDNNFIQYDAFFIYVAYAVSIQQTPVPEPKPEPIPIPEPSSFCLLIVGLLAVFLFKKVLTTADR